MKQIDEGGGYDEEDIQRSSNTYSRSKAHTAPEGEKCRATGRQSDDAARSPSDRACMEVAKGSRNG